MTRTEEFAASLEQLATADWDDAACQRLFDTLAAAAIGLHTDEGQAVRTLLASRGASPADAAGEDLLMLLSVAIRSTEIDDINIDSCTTVGSVVIPAVLAAATTSRDVTARDLIDGIVAGYEAMVRFGEAIDGARILYKGIWPTYVTAPLSAAAATSTVWRLGRQKMAHALSLSLARSSVMATAASQGISPRSWLLGRACCEGYAAARAAAAGIAGSGDEFAAFSSRHGIPLAHETLLRAEGRLPAILRMDTKPYPTARQGLSAIEAFRSLLPLPFTPDEISSVRVRVPAQLCDMIARPPNGRIGSMVSVAYQMALAVFEPEKLSDTLRTTLPDADRISRFMDKVAIEADLELTALYPETWGAQVNVRSTSADEISSGILHPDGSAHCPPRWEGIMDKYVTLIGAGKVGNATLLPSLAHMCRDLPSRDRIDVQSEIIGRLCAAAGLGS